MVDYDRFTSQSRRSQHLGFRMWIRMALRLFQEQKANKILGIDISEKMIKKAKEINLSLNIEYLVKDFYSLNDINDSYDLVFSSLAIHYIQDFENLTKQVRKLLKPKGTFLFSVEHPIFTAEGSQQ